MRANPDADVSERVKASRLPIWFVLMDRRRPISRHATQDQAQKDWHVQPVAAPHQQVVPANYTHAGLISRHECSDSFLFELSGTGHKHSPRYFRKVMLLAGAGAKC